MIINSFGLIENDKMLVFSYSYKKNIYRKNVKSIYLQQNRQFYYNVLAFLFAFVLLLFLKVDSVIWSMIITALFVFSFFYTKYDYGCVIISKNNKKKLKISLNRSEYIDAKIIVEMFINYSADND